MSTSTLSKSSFGAGLQCHKRLWTEKRDSGLLPKPSLSQQAIFDQGHEVGAWSHRLFPDGVLLSDELDFKVHLESSHSALTLRKPLFEPAFAVPGAYARADILEPADSVGWNLLEVKSASNVWESNGNIKSVYLQDIAFQVYVYLNAGVDIRQSFLVFLNSAYVRHGEIDPQRLFQRVNVSGQVEELLPLIPGRLNELSRMLQSATVPEIEIGPHCFSPYECTLKSHCWKQVPVDSVFTLTHAGDRAWKWWNEGIIRVSDLPQTETFSEKQSVQIAVERSRQPHVDVAAVQRFVAGLRYPLNFLDFETVMPAVPIFEGCRPYSQVPFQFSLHLQNSSTDELKHREYLADGSDDPRGGFLQALQASLGTEGSIVSYNASFETSRLRELASQYPEHREWINLALPRFHDADLLALFRSFALYHPDQHGSASIKSVLPAFTDLSYSDLSIQDGGTASNQFLLLLKGLVPPNEISDLRGNLLKYCERDTLAMVKLVEKLLLITRYTSANESSTGIAEQVTRIRVDELLHFKSFFDQDDEQQSFEWSEGAEPEGDGYLSMPQPIYPRIINDFFALASQPWWSDYQYTPETAAKMVQNDAMIASASLADIKKMLTFCVRGERFCDGHWGAMIRQGRIRAILCRLEQIRETIP